MDRDQIAAIERQMEEDHRLDREALDRLKRFIPNGGSGNGTIPVAVTQTTTSRQPFIPEEGSSLKHAIRDIMNSDPSQKWTNPKMLQYLEKIKFPLNAQKPVVSISQATQRLFTNGEIKRLKAGVGNAPSIYRGLTQLELAAKQESDGLHEEES